PRAQHPTRPIMPDLGLFNIQTEALPRGAASRGSPSGVGATRASRCARSRQASCFPRMSFNIAFIGQPPLGRHAATGSFRPLMEPCGAFGAVVILWAATCPTLAGGINVTGQDLGKLFALPPRLAPWL